MVRQDLIWLAVAHLFFLAMVLPYKKLMPKRTAMYVMMLLPLVFLGNIVVTWGGHMLRISNHVDAHLAYEGIENNGTPYVGPKQNQTPTYFAFARFVLRYGDGSFEAYDKIVLMMNYFSLGLLVGCILLAVFSYFRDQESLSEPTLVALGTVFMAGMLPAVKNLYLANINILVAPLVAFYLYMARTFKNDRADFIGGIALGIAFMIKPYLLFVLIYLFFLGLRRKKPYVLIGLVTAGIAGFLASLLVSGIGVGTYKEFLFKTVGGRHYGINLSLLKYFPAYTAKITGATSLIVLSIFSVVAFFLSKKNRGGELPWFFVTLLLFPILWEEHLMGIFPAFIFLILSREREWEQLLISAVASCLILFSSLMKVPLALNALLFGLWLWGVCLPSSEASPARP